MTIQSFITKAIKGGWEDAPPVGTPFKVIGRNVFIEDEDKTVFAVAEILMNPTAWQAVGKVEGWDKHDVEMRKIGLIPDYHHKMLNMVRALLNDETREQYLETL